MNEITSLSCPSLINNYVFYKIKNIYKVLFTIKEKRCKIYSNKKKFNNIYKIIELK